MCPTTAALRATTTTTACFGVLKAEGEKHGLTIATFNPLSWFSDADDLSDVRSIAGLSIWREDDLVHLTAAAAYNDFAAVMLSQAENNGKQPLTGQVRRRLLSVIPAPTKSAPSVWEPEWINGKLRSMAASVAALEEGGEGAPGEGPATSPTKMKNKE